MGAWTSRGWRASLRNDLTQVLISGIRHVVLSRPPYLQPRLRDVDRTEIEALRARIASALAISAGARIELRSGAPSIRETCPTRR